MARIRAEISGYLKKVATLLVFSSIGHASPYQIPPLDWASLSCGYSLSGTASPPKIHLSSESARFWVENWESFVEAYAESPFQTLEMLDKKLVQIEDYELLVGLSHGRNETLAPWVPFLSLRQDLAEVFEKPRILNRSKIERYAEDLAHFIDERTKPPKVLGFNISQSLLTDLQPILAALEYSPRDLDLKPEFERLYKILSDQKVGSVIFDLLFNFSPTIKGMGPANVFYKTSPELRDIGLKPITVLKDPKTLNLIAPALPFLTETLGEDSVSIVLSSDTFTGIYEDFLFHEKNQWRQVKDSRSAFESALFEYTRVRFKSRLLRLEQLSIARWPFLSSTIGELGLSLFPPDRNFKDADFFDAKSTSAVLDYLVSLSAAQIETDPILSAVLDPEGGASDLFLKILRRGFKDGKSEALGYAARLYAKMIFATQRKLAQRESPGEREDRTRALQFIEAVFN